MHMKILPLHEVLHLVGGHVDDGEASFSDEPFKHYEEITITSIGQPMFNYVAQSWHPEMGIPMYRQTGFLHIVPGTVDIVSLDIVYDLGVVTIEEETTNAASSEYLTQTRRVFRLHGDRLEQIFYVATSDTPELDGAYACEVQEE